MSKIALFSVTGECTILCSGSVKNQDVYLAILFIVRATHTNICIYIKGTDLKITWCENYQGVKGLFPASTAMYSMLVNAGNIFFSKLHYRQAVHSLWTPGWRGEMVSQALQGSTWHPQ